MSEVLHEIKNRSNSVAQRAKNPRVSLLHSGCYSPRVGATVFLRERETSCLSQMHVFWLCVYPRELVNVAKTKRPGVLKTAYFHN